MTSEISPTKAVLALADPAVSAQTTVVEVEVPADAPRDPDELRYVLYLGIAELLVDRVIGGTPADRRDGVLRRLEMALDSAEPALRFARHETASRLEAAERVVRMRGKDILATERWLIPRLEHDIAAYRARIETLSARLGEGTA
jgi:hypothetical protein